MSLSPLSQGSAFVYTSSRYRTIVELNAALVTNRNQATKNRHSLDYTTIGVQGLRGGRGGGALHHARLGQPFYC